MKLNAAIDWDSCDKVVCWLKVLLRNYAARPALEHSKKPSCISLKYIWKEG